MRVTYNIDYSYIEQYVRQQIANAKVQEHPYPFAQIEGLLPEDYYELLMDALPLPQDMGIDHSGSFNFAIFGGDQKFLELSASRRKLWMEFDTIINQPVIRLELIKLFKSYIKYKYDSFLGDGWLDRIEATAGKKTRTAMESGDVSIDMLRTSVAHILLSTRDSFFPPHIDDAESIFTYLLYLPRHNAYAQHGTKVHFVKNLEAIKDYYKTERNAHIWCPGEDNITTDEFTFPYHRNTLVAFLCTPSAIHSAMFKDLNFCRYLMQTQVFLKEDITSAMFSGWKKGQEYFGYEHVQQKAAE